MLNVTTNQICLNLKLPNKCWKNTTKRCLCCYLQTKPFPLQAHVFKCLQHTSFWKHCGGKKDKLLTTNNFSFSLGVFYPLTKNFLPFSSNLNLSSANSFSFEGYKIYHLCVKRLNLLVYMSKQKHINITVSGGLWTCSFLSIGLNSLLHRYPFWRINNRQLLKTMWKKKKLLIMNNFFFSHNVFYSIR